MVRQHDAAGADPDRRGAASDMANQDRGRRRGDAGHVVMLGQPEAPVAPALGMLREIEAVAEGLGGVAALGDRGEVENGEDWHRAYMGRQSGKTRRRQRAGGGGMP